MLPACRKGRRRGQGEESLEGFCAVQLLLKMAGVREK